MPNPQADLDALVAALNGIRVRECPLCWGRKQVTADNVHGYKQCPSCQGLGTIPNEPAQTVWEELTRECPVCRGLGDGPEDVGCNKTGRISQDIRAWPTSAVRGMLMGAMLAYDSRYSYITMWTQAPEALLAAFTQTLDPQGGE